MRKKENYQCGLFTLLLSMFAISMNAQDTPSGFRTADDGKTYSFAVLSQIEESGVSYTDGCYVIEKNDTISANDQFELDADATVKFADKVSFVILGQAQLTVPDNHSTTLTRLSDNATPYNIKIDNTSGTEVKNVVFEYLGLESASTGAINVSHCSFMQHNGNSAAALYFITNGEESIISDCRFEACEKAAIGSSANASQPMHILDCTFVRNSTRNGNIPQINITASKILIEGCTIEGDPNSLKTNNKVGGIGISNFMNFAETNTIIRNCTITHNRYGIGTVGPIQVRIEGNTIQNNNHEDIPMNGGSGISLYDPYRLTNAVIASNIIKGNHWGITIIGCKDVNIGQPGNSETDSPGNNTFGENGFDGQLYDLYNNSTLTVYAQNNTWGVEEQTPANIESVIFHQADDPSLGRVIYLSDEEESGIANHIHSDKKQTSPIFNLNGSRLHTLPTHGIYIKDKKKIIR